MEHSLLRSLAPIQTRQRTVSALRGAVSGLMLAGCCGTVAAFVAWLTTTERHGLTLTWLLLFGTAVGAVVGGLRRRPVREAARIVDQRCRLQDRLTTAVEFIQRGMAPQSAVHELQVREAESHVHEIRPSDVVPIRCPAPTPYAVALTVLTAVISLLPPRQMVQADRTEPLVGVFATADEIESQLQAMERFATAVNNREVPVLVQQLRRELAGLRKPQTELRDALATISEMQARIADKQAQYSNDNLDVQLKPLGNALNNAPEFRDAAKQLQGGHAAEAAKAMLQVDQVDLTPDAARSTADQLKDVSETMEEQGLDQMSESAAQLADAIREHDPESAVAAAHELAKELNKAALRKQIGQMLAASVSRLNDSKARCQQLCNSESSTGDDPASGRGSGQGRGQQDTMAQGRDAAKSLESGRNYGMTSSNNRAGEATALPSTRQLQEITGQLGDGPSEFETTTSDEGHGAAQRAYAEAFQKYEQMSEAVLDTEPVPSGHRQTIRKYFELIRPQSADELPAATPRDMTP